MTQDSVPLSTSASRRALLRGAAVGGAVLWTAPAVQVLSMSAASAQTASPASNALGGGPAPTPTQTAAAVVCTPVRTSVAEAQSLRVTGPLEPLSTARVVSSGGSTASPSEVPGITDGPFVVRTLSARASTEQATSPQPPAGEQQASATATADVSALVLDLGVTALPGLPQAIGGVSAVGAASTGSIRLEVTTLHAEVEVVTGTNGVPRTPRLSSKVGSAVLKKDGLTIQDLLVENPFANTTAGLRIRFAVPTTTSGRQGVTAMVVEQGDLRVEVARVEAEAGYVCLPPAPAQP